MSDHIILSKDELKRLIEWGDVTMQVEFDEDDERLYEKLKKELEA